MTSLYPLFKERGTGNGFFKLLELSTGLRFIPFACGRSAMVSGLKALGLQRTDEILVPPFLGQCVLSALSRAVFPAMSPSGRSRAILVYHQFGFPQDIRAIESYAHDKNLTILNDCANTLFSCTNGNSLLEWGDFTIISLSKLYSCGLGGGLYSRRKDIYENILDDHRELSDGQRERADLALETLIKINSGVYGAETVYEINGLYGYLPDVAAFPEKSHYGLPSTEEELHDDITHRKNIWSIVSNLFPDRVPECENIEVIPFAIPIFGDPEKLEVISNKIRNELSLDVPVLHFDFARNMLNPDYRQSLVIGCHDGWDEGLVVKICEIIKGHIK